MKLIVICAPDVNLYHEIESIVQLFEHNLEYFHLRKPTFSEAEYEDFISKIPEQYRNKIIIHNYHNLAIKYNLKGVHFSSYTKNGLKGTNLHKSKSCHSIEEIKQIKNLYNYVFLSPIFPSISKPDYQSNFNTQELKTFLTDKNDLPQVIALGGISFEKIPLIKQLGFAGMAVLGTIWQEKNPEKRLIKFQQLQNNC